MSSDAIEPFSKIEIKNVGAWLSLLCSGHYDLRYSGRYQANKGKRIKRKSHLAKSRGCSANVDGDFKIFYYAAELLLICTREPHRAIFELESSLRGTMHHPVPRDQESVHHDG